jgi:hypothetical protein
MHGQVLGRCMNFPQRFPFDTVSLAHAHTPGALPSELLIPLHRHPTSSGKMPVREWLLSLAK